jgi:two-component system sensor histidine kinase KdpD
MAERIGSEFFVIYVDIGVDDTPDRRRTLDENIRFAENLGAQIVKTRGKKVAAEVAKIVREKHITQVVFGRSALTGWRRLLYLSAIHDFIRDAPAVDVHIVTQEPKRP